MTGTMILSFATYWTTPKHSIVSNACNASSLLSTLSILIAILWLYPFKKIKVLFSKFQKWCLAISGAIAIFWAIVVWGLNGTGVVPNILTQILMLIGYLVTAEQLWYSRKNTESFVTWICIALASTIAIYTAWVSSDFLAGLYAVRASLASITLVWLMYRAKQNALHDQNRVIKTSQAF